MNDLYLQLKLILKEVLFNIMKVWDMKYRRGNKKCIHFSWKYKGEETT